MEVPLVVKSVIQNDEQLLEIWRDGKKELVKPPFLPYLVTKASLNFSTEPVIVEEFMGKPLSTLKEKKLYKCYFPTVKHISNINKSLEKSVYAMGDNRIPKLVCENHTEFRERILIDEPDFFRAFPNTNELRMLFFDIETATKNGIDLKRVISIAYCSNDGIIRSNQDADEQSLLLWFLKAFMEVDPDICVGYNHLGFDFPYIFDKCAKNGINYTVLGRDGSVEFWKRGRDAKVDIGGRAQFDIFYAVLADQTLFGLKNKRMKTVAKHYGIPTIEEDTSNTIEIPLDKLKEYNESDVFITKELFEIYFGGYYYSAILDGIPLNMMLEGSSTFHSSIFQGSGLHERGIISDGMNQDRHPEIYHRAKKDKEDANYQGAIVSIMKKGYFPKVYKVDVKGMYSAIEIMLNASPDTTQIDNYKRYSPDLNFYKDDYYLICEVPDDVLNRTVVIKIDQSHDSMLRVKLREIRRKRAEIKSLMASATTKTEKQKLESQQWGLKVKANIPYGYNGSPSCRWGDTAVSIITTAVGRILITEIIKFIEDVTGNGCIEVDTDGVYISDWISIDDLNAFISRRAEELFRVKNEIVLDFDEYKEGYFIGMKNYILHDKNDNLIIHGNSLKSSSMPGCFDSALEKLSACVLSRRGDIRQTINDVLDIEKYELGDLVLSKTLQKPPSQYSRSTFMGKLIDQAILCGIDVEEGTQLEYIKTLDRYQVVSTVRTKKEVDQTYYRGLIERLVVDFGFKNELMTRTIIDAEEEWA